MATEINWKCAIGWHDWNLLDVNMKCSRPKPDKRNEASLLNGCSRCHKRRLFGRCDYLVLIRRRPTQEERIDLIKAEMQQGVSDE